MRDIRLLTLKKQHYMDCYEDILDSKYSCWGNIDGIDIEEVIVGDGMLPISAIWEKLGDKQETINGSYGSQSIGIIRCVEEEDLVEIGKNFWEEENFMPFMAVVFLQLDDATKYKTISKNIEWKYNGLTRKRGEEEKCNVVSFITFDNADIVLLLSSNSIKEMERVIKEIRRNDDVKYLYPIMGATNDYLSMCKHENTILATWNGTKCFLEEKFARVTLRIETSGNPNVINRIKYLLRQHLGKENSEKSDCDKIKCCYSLNNEVVNVELPELSVKMLLELSLPNGFVTHQNQLYGNGIYSIETSFSFDEYLLSELLEDSVIPEVNQKQKSWCRIKLKKYIDELQNVKVEKKDGLYASYQAIVQTLNTLTQYEQFGLLSEVFYLIFPNFEMFDQLLDKAYSNVEKNDYEGIEEIERTVRRYINSVNSLMYHTTSSGQTWFMIPGRSDISFTVPIKLVLMYLYVVRQVAKILNDCDYKYECILAPEMERRPITTILDFGMENDDRLICVRMSKRTLFWPKNLIITLAHEVGHYIGKDIRKRSKRKDCIVETLAEIMAETIFPKDLTVYVSCPNSNIILKKTRVAVKKEIKEKAKVFFDNNIKESKISKEYYSRELKKILYDCCQMFLNEINYAWGNSLPPVFDEIVNGLEKKTENFREELQYIFAVYKELKEHINYHLAKNTMESVVKDLFTIYQECFSDIVAYDILGCKVEDFEESFRVSEGIGEEAEYTNPEQFLRKLMLNALQQDLSKLDEKDNSQNIKSIYDYLWMQENLYEYVKECHKAVEQRIVSSECKDEVEKLRKFYRLFQNEHTDNCSEIYESIVQAIDMYTKNVSEQYERTFEKIV